MPNEDTGTHMTGSEQDLQNDTRFESDNSLSPNSVILLNRVIFIRNSQRGTGFRTLLAHP